MRIEYRWLDGSTWFVSIFLLVWEIIIFGVGVLTYNRGEALIAVICLVMFFVGSYSTLAHFFNATTLLVNPTRVIHHLRPPAGNTHNGGFVSGVRRPACA